MILYYPTKFHFNTMNSFRVIVREALSAPNPPGPGTPKSPGQIGLRKLCATLGPRARLLCPIFPSVEFVVPEVVYLFITYFSSFRQIVHRDVAARNVLLGRSGVAMITNIGMSRDMYQEYFYEKAIGVNQCACFLKKIKIWLLA